jgi:hypothetical protein
MNERPFSRGTQLRRVAQRRGAIGSMIGCTLGATLGCTAAAEPGSGSGATVALVEPGADLQTLPLLRKEDLKYAGAFRASTRDPSVRPPGVYSTGGNVLAFDASRNSLFIDGHIGEQYIGEIASPSDSAYTTLAAVRIARDLQPLGRAIAGPQLRRINPSDPNPQLIGGALVYGGRLIVSAYSYYDAGQSQAASHFVRSRDLSAPGEVTGPIRLRGVPPRWVGAYMAEIPHEWTEAFGGPVLAGLAGVPIASAQSNGPSATVIDPSNLADFASTTVVGYRADAPLTELLGLDADRKNPAWNLTSQVRGIAFAKGTRSVLFIGQHGLGEPCYGTGQECRDPHNPDKGPHAYPLAYQVWAYDVLDLVRARRGRIDPGRIKPYAIWNFDLPFQGKDGVAKPIGAVALDTAGGRLFVSQLGAYDRDYASEPIIHVLRIR